MSVAIVCVCLCVRATLSGPVCGCAYCISSDATLNPAHVALVALIIHHRRGCFVLIGTRVLAIARFMGASSRPRGGNPVKHFAIILAACLHFQMTSFLKRDKGTLSGLIDSREGRGCLLCPFANGYDSLSAKAHAAHKSRIPETSCFLWLNA